MNFVGDLVDIALRLAPHASRQTVLQNEGSDTNSVQPARNVVAFFIYGQMLISATRRDHDSRAVGFFFGGQIHCHSWLGNVRNRTINNPALSTFLDFLRWRRGIDWMLQM